MTKNEVIETIRTWIKTTDDEYDIEERGRVYGMMDCLELVKQIDDLDKIRAEIECLTELNSLKLKVLQIIDKYRYRSENEDERSDEK